MGPLNIRNTLYTIFLVTALFSQTRKEKAILEFIDARYSANIVSVRSFLDKDFISYMNTPIVKVTLKKDIKSFYTLTDYNQWKNCLPCKYRWLVYLYCDLYCD